MKRTEPRPVARVIPIASDVDIVEARMASRSLAKYIGFDGADQVMLAPAVSEVARNIIEYAKSGKVVLSVFQDHSRGGLEAVARDEGAGIADIQLGVTGGLQTSIGFGPT